MAAVSKLGFANFLTYTICILNYPFGGNNSNKQTKKLANVTSTLFPHVQLPSHSSNWSITISMVVLFGWTMAAAIAIIYNHSPNMHSKRNITVTLVWAYIRVRVPELTVYSVFNTKVRRLKYFFQIPFQWKKSFFL